MDLNALSLFVTAVQSGSLSAAASRTGIPLPTLSRKIRALEQELAVVLFERSVRGVKLTDAGLRLYEQASRGIELLNSAKTVLKDEQHQLKGLLRLSLPPALEHWWVMLSAFQTAYPGIHLFVYSSERRVDLIVEGIDVALRIGAISHESMVARKLFRYRHKLVASPALIARYGLPQSPKELAPFPCATWTLGAYAQTVWKLGDEVHQPQALLSTNDYAHLRNRALAGEVITELPPLLCQKDLATGRLIHLLPEYPLPEQELNLLYPSHRHTSPIVRAYLDFCSDYWRERKTLLA